MVVVRVPRVCSLRPKDGDSPVQTRSAIVFGKEVVGLQG